MAHEVDICDAFLFSFMKPVHVSVPAQWLYEFAFWEKLAKACLSDNATDSEWNILGFGAPFLCLFFLPSFLLSFFFFSFSFFLNFLGWVFFLLFLFFHRFTFHLHFLASVRYLVFVCGLFQCDKPVLVKKSLKSLTALTQFNEKARNTVVEHQGRFLIPGMG